MRVKDLARLALAVGITGVCAMVVVRTVDVGRVAQVLGAADPAPLLLAFALALLLPFWRGARLVQLLDPWRRPRRGTLTRIAAEVLLWSFILPFKLGELSFPWLLHRRVGLRLAEALGLFLLVRLCDLFAIMGLVALAVAVAGVSPALGVPWPVPAALGGLLLAAPLLLVAVAGRIEARRAAGVAERRWLGELLASAGHARTVAAQTWLALTTFAIWGTHLVIARLALEAVGANTDWAAAMLAGGAGNVAFALPVSGVLGLGPQQVAFAFAAQATGIEATMALAAALAVYAVVVAAACLGGLVALLTADNRTEAPGSVGRHNS